MMAYGDRDGGPLMAASCAPRRRASPTNPPSCLTLGVLQDMDVLHRNITEALRMHPPLIMVLRCGGGEGRGGESRGEKMGALRMHRPSSWCSDAGEGMVHWVDFAGNIALFCKLKYQL